MGSTFLAFDMMYRSKLCLINTLPIAANKLTNLMVCLSYLQMMAAVPNTVATAMLACGVPSTPVFQNARPHEGLQSKYSQMTSMHA